MATEAIHYGLGMVPGALYGALRNRLPLLGAGRGVLYGLILWAANDEYLNFEARSGGFIPCVSTRIALAGLVGHIALGAATDTGIDVLGAHR